jgi:hypothetical protein
MSNPIVSPLGTPWITQATWTGESPREAVYHRGGRGRRDRRHRRHRAS